MAKTDYRARIGRLNGDLKAFVDLAEPAPGGGLAWGIKSNIAVKGLAHTAGIGAYSDQIAREDSLVVKRIRASGGDILGTVNMHEGALGATTDNRAYGRTQNPWRAGYTPGGSSGGSGAAVGALLCDVALGSDTMGSIRIPAAYCGVQGHKPTTGIVPTDGVIALSPTLDHVGPLARDVETLWTALHILADWEPSQTLAPSALADLRLGVWEGAGDVERTDAVITGFASACAEIEGAGGALIPVAPPRYEYTRSRRAGLLISEVEGAEVHGVTPEGPDPEGFSETFMGLMKWGIRQPAEKIEAAYRHVAEVRAAAPALFDEVDFVIAPTAPQEAFSFETPTPANQADFTAWADFAALPATAVFTGLSEAGLPLSCQVIGPEGRDRETLQVAAALEEIFGKPQVPPGFER